MKKASVVQRGSGFAALALGCISILGCGGSGNGESLTWTEGVYLEKNVYQARCENPRTGLDPFNNDRPYPDQQGSVAHENFFLRSWTNELYLWYDEVEDQDPNLFSTADYFETLKTTMLTPSGQPKDNFHFTQDTEDYLNSSVGGVSFGYGMSFAAISTAPPREFRISDVVPGSPADQAGIVRGMRITSVDGADMINGGDLDTLNAGLFPGQVGEEHVFGMEAYGSNVSNNFAVSSAQISSVPVKSTSVVSTPTGDVGYIHFNSHIRPAELDLFEAFSFIASNGVTDLVLDLRYNGGGLLAIASQVSHMIAGSGNTSGDSFYSIQFNDQHPTRDPVTLSSLEPLPFVDQGLELVRGELASGTVLPSLNLSRVFILSTSRTCSASEAIINGLRGIDVDVVLIGDTTCGKPYGFYPQDNCGTTYFSVQFTGVNDKGFGEYPDGFSPQNKPNLAGVPVPGCWVRDDFSGALGDPNEALFSAALQYRDNQTCPPIPTLASNTSKTQVQGSQKPSNGQALTLPEEPGLTNAILLVK